MVLSKENYDSQFFSHASCKILGALSEAASFADMKENERSGVILSIIYATKSSAGYEHNLLESHLRKKTRRGEASDGYRTTCYAIRVQKVCASAFSAVMKIGLHSVHKHGFAVV